MKDRIIRSTCALLALLALAATAARADKPPTTQPKVTFKVVKTPYAVEMFGEDPILTEGMKYVAVVRARLGGWDGRVPLENVLRSMVASTPREYLPSEEIRSFLMTQTGRAIRHRMVGGDWTGTREEIPRYLGPGTYVRPRPSRVPSAGAGAYGTRRPSVGRTGARPDQPFSRQPPSLMGRGRVAPRPAGTSMRPLERPREAPVHEFLILAPSEERAKELVRALIVVYNHGWAYPGGTDLLQATENEKARLLKLQPQLAEAEKRLADFHYPSHK